MWLSMFFLVPWVGLWSVNEKFPGHSETGFLFVILMPVINNDNCNTCTVYTNVAFIMTVTTSI